MQICALSEMETSESSGSNEDDEYVASKKSKSNGNKLKKKRSSYQDMFNNNVSRALDTNKISDRQEVQVLLPVAAALGHDPSSITIWQLVLF